MSGGACACCSSMGRSPPRKPRSATCRRMKRRTSACWPRRHASPSACSPGYPGTSSTGRRAKWWCSPSCASRAATRRAPPPRSTGRCLPRACPRLTSSTSGAASVTRRPASITTRRSPGMRVPATCGLPTSSWPGKRARRCAAETGRVRDSIDQMSAGARQERAWSYWYGRALAAQGEETGSRAYYLRVAGRPDFYGLLAEEELGYMVALPDKIYLPGEDEVAAAKRDPGIARALELIRLGLRTEGVREWIHTIRFFDDAKLIAAAEVAHRAEIYDRVIETANKTVRVHNFALRYPVPYQDVFQEYAKTHGVDPALVLGLVRQESRFLQESRSSAGATGLMQLMPRTARYVAAKLGLRNYRPHHVGEVQTNVGLGTGYLKLVLNQVGHPILASTAYNAGPARARRWRDSRPLEGAIYVETIPISETRDYVKNVMANSVFYAAVLENKLTPIKARLGTVPPRTGAEPTAEDELP